MSLPLDFLVLACIGIASIALIFTELIRAKMIRQTLQEALRDSQPDERPSIVASMAELLNDTPVSQHDRSEDSTRNIGNLGTRTLVDLSTSTFPEDAVSQAWDNPGKSLLIEEIPHRRIPANEDVSRDCSIISSGYSYNGSRGGDNDIAAKPYFPLSGQNCSIFIADIASFGGTFRTSEDRAHIRRIMYTSLRDTFETSGVPWASCHRVDSGDGAIIVVPPGIPTSSIADPLLGELAHTLRVHNARATKATQIQLRAALHVGPVISDSNGVSGDVILYAARLVESPVLKRQLARTSADLGVIASDFVYDTTIKNRANHANSPEYHQVRFRVKESSMTAWMWLFGNEKTF
jgi:hypothetical protein